MSENNRDVESFTKKVAKSMRFVFSLNQFDYVKLFTTFGKYWLEATLVFLLENVCLTERPRIEQIHRGLQLSVLEWPLEDYTVLQTELDEQDRKEKMFLNQGNFWQKLPEFRVKRESVVKSVLIYKDVKTVNFDLLKSFDKLS